MISGGSAANTLSTFMSFGGSGAFIGKVSDDCLGDVFRHDLKAQGVMYTTSSAPMSAQTGRSHVMITSDGERTMATQLGANEHFAPEDIDEALVAASKTIFLEGYLFDSPSAKEAFMTAAQMAQTHDTKVALTLSSVSCVNAHRDDFVKLTKSHVDILFGNEKELKALTMKDDFNEAVEAAKTLCDTLVVTRGSKGALIVQEGVHTDIIAAKVEKIEDTTGAGDSFAGGVLFGFAKGFSALESGRLGAEAAAAAATISHIGARSVNRDFSKLVP